VWLKSESRAAIAISQDVDFFGRESPFRLAFSWLWLVSGTLFTTLFLLTRRRSFINTNNDDGSFAFVHTQVSGNKAGVSRGNNDPVSLAQWLKLNGEELKIIAGWVLCIFGAFMLLCEPPPYFWRDRALCRSPRSNSRRNHLNGWSFDPNGNQVYVTLEKEYLFNRRCSINFRNFYFQDLSSLLFKLYWKDEERRGRYQRNHNLIVLYYTILQLDLRRRLRELSSPNNISHRIRKLYRLTIFFFFFLQVLKLPLFLSPNKTTKVDPSTPKPMHRSSPSYIKERSAFACCKNVGRS